MDNLCNYRLLKESKSLKNLTYLTLLPPYTTQHGFNPSAEK